MKNSTIPPSLIYPANPLRRSSRMLRRAGPPGEVALSVITVAELEYGARKSAAVERNLSALHQFFIPFDILSFDYNATVEYGIIRSELEAKGTPIGPLDTLIAAHAKSLNYILVTNNEKEFSRVRGLQFENWVK